MVDIDEFPVAIAENEAIEPMMQIPAELPVLPLRDIVIYPFMIVPLFVSRDKSIRAVEEALNAVTARAHEMVDGPGQGDARG